MGVGGELMTKLVEHDLLILQTTACLKESGTEFFKKWSLKCQFYLMSVHIEVILERKKEKKHIYISIVD